MSTVVASFTPAMKFAMNISYVRPLDYGQHTTVTVYTVKTGRKIIRLRAEMVCKETGKLVATGVGTWMPL